ncbi:MAG: hypothetical protein EF813_02040 [Methanosarcinales archaeon]|nr:MAG: hypothetical protein EF813_02040 [Methanosarcinales archaeon]
MRDYNTASRCFRCFCQRDHPRRGTLQQSRIKGDCDRPHLHNPDRVTPSEPRRVFIEKPCEESPRTWMFEGGCEAVHLHVAGTLVRINIPRAIEIR